MIDLLIHPKAAQQLAGLQRGATHAVLLTGDAGQGKKTIARRFAMNLLGIQSLANQPYVLEIGASDGVGIEDVRSLRQFLQRTTTGDAVIRRVVLLFGADTMTTEAANALLKTLEEPPSDTVIVLTASNQSAVPVTVRSRVQAVALLPVSLKAAQEYAGFNDYSSDDIAKAHRLAGGRPALMHALLADPESHALTSAIANAKRILAATTYERLCLVETYSKDKQATELLLFGLERITQSLVQLGAEQSDATRLRRAHKTLKSVSKAQQALAQSASVKLVLTDLFANM